MAHCSSPELEQIQPATTDGYLQCLGVHFAEIRGVDHSASLLAHGRHECNMANLREVHLWQTS